MNKLKFFIKYLNHQLKAKGEHGLHSPFAFDLYRKVINDEREYYAFDDIESIRAKLLLSDKEIKISDYGAGSKINSSDKRKVSDIAKNSLSSKKEGRLLFRLVNHFQPEKVLELGTSLGVSTMYLAGPDSGREIITVEGCPNTAKVASLNFDKLNFTNIHLIRDTFDQALPGLLKKGYIPDLAFIDGNHTKDATLRYFNMLSEVMNDEGLIVLDDIHWSEGMEQAWDEIKETAGVTVTMDLFHLGLVFFRKEQAAEHFKLKF